MIVSPTCSRRPHSAKTEKKKKREEAAVRGRIVPRRDLVLAPGCLRQVEYSIYLSVSAISPASHRVACLVDAVSSRDRYGLIQGPLLVYPLTPT